MKYSMSIEGEQTTTIPLSKTMCIELPESQKNLTELSALIVPTLQIYSILFYQLNVSVYRVKSALLVTDGAGPQTITQSCMAI